MDKECRRVWLICNGGEEQIIYPDDLLEFWATHSISTIRIKR